MCEPLAPARRACCRARICRDGQASLISSSRPPSKPLAGNTELEATSAWHALHLGGTVSAPARQTNVDRVAKSIRSNFVRHVEVRIEGDDQLSKRQRARKEYAGAIVGLEEMEIAEPPQALAVGHELVIPEQIFGAVIRCQIWKIDKGQRCGRSGN